MTEQRAGAYTSSALCTTFPYTTFLFHCTTNPVFHHCGTCVKDTFTKFIYEDYDEGIPEEVVTTTWHLWSCQTCSKPMLEEVEEWSKIGTQRLPPGEMPEFGMRYNGEDLGSSFIYPSQEGSRPPCPDEVPKAIAEDYNEACLVLADSPKASAALSRRCLQNLLREVAKVKPNDLAKEIQEVLDRHELPSHIVEAIDAIRHIGNFSAHPEKSQRTGEIVTIAPEEATWNLEVLEALFDFYCVQPVIAQKKIEAFKTKLANINEKLKMKQPKAISIEKEKENHE